MCFLEFFQRVSKQMDKDVNTVLPIIIFSKFSCPGLFLKDLNCCWLNGNSPKNKLKKEASGQYF